MRGLVIYDTSHGNTKTIAEAIAETLRESGIEVNLLHVRDAKKVNSRDYDFLVLGSPTRFGTMSLAVRGFLGKMKPDEWMNKRFAAFDTELPDNLDHKEWSAAEKIASRLVENKLTELMPVLKTAVMGNKGPLKDGEIERTHSYAKELAAKLNIEKPSGRAIPTT